jgi:NTE family protein
MRVGLVLGAGGIVGASWLIGALEALQDETGWDPREADCIVGTSAGSVVGAMLAAGQEPARMGALVTGAGGDPLEEAEDRTAMLAQTAVDMRPGLHVPAVGPASIQVLLRAARHPRRHTPGAVMAGLLPRGFVSTAPIERLVEGIVGDGWPDHPHFAAVAADLHTGRRVAFGRPDAPPASAAQAVAASCAIPGFYRPVRIGGRPYVDGGVCSMSNVDLLCDQDLDLVVALNPTSSLEAVAGWGPADRFGALMRGASGRRLGAESRKLRSRGTEVLLVQPGAEDVAVMGVNFMSKRRRTEVLEQARRSTALDLRERRRQGDALPSRRRARRTRPAAARPLRAA